MLSHSVRSARRFPSRIPSRFHGPRRCLSALACLALAQLPAQAQAPGISREQMWPAPTTADWARPCLIPWQRDFSDARELARKTGRPLLLCVNMDGEIASEHYAGVRYRDPAIAALYAPYVTVIASVYRHTPRDHEEDGTRIPCPRFGTVTCGEHIAIEPQLYEEYFEGQRVAPRHVAVELDGTETYDIYYALDTQSVFNTIEERIAQDPPPAQRDRGDLTLLERLASTDSADREEVEAAFRSGDSLLRRRVLTRLAELPDLNPLALVRLALSSPEAAERELALDILARESSPEAVDLIALALRLGVSAEREAQLITALERLALAVPRAGTLARALAALGRDAPSTGNDFRPADWTALPQSTATVDELSARLAYRVDAQRLPADAPPSGGAPGTGTAETAHAGAGGHADHAGQLDLATAFLELALHPDTARRSAALMREDAMELASAARAGDAHLRWRADALLCLAYFSGGETEQARQLAIKTAQQIPAGAQDLGVARVLTLFVENRHERLNSALRRRRRAPAAAGQDRGGAPAADNWDASWLAEARGAFEVLVRLEADTEELTIAHHTLLYRLWATGEAARVLDQAIARYPGSWELHRRLRGRLLAEKSLDSLDGLEGAYERLLSGSPGDGVSAADLAGSSAPVLFWYAGYASLVAAEHHRRAATGEPDRAASAQGAYLRAMVHLEQSIASGGATEESAGHYIAMALAGRAKLALAAGDLLTSLEHLLAAFTRSPAAAGVLDGLNDSAVSTARMLLARLMEGDHTQAAAHLEAALAALPAEALTPPAFETRTLPGRGPNARGRRPGSRQ